MQKPELEVSEIFTSIQNEGPMAGHPVIILRLFGTNLEIKNDAYGYAWDITENSNREILTVDEVLERFSTLENNFFHLVITGGEPLLQQERLIKLLNKFSDEDHFNKKPFVEIETNGTIEPLEALVKLVDIFNVNLKLSNSSNEPSNGDAYNRLKPNIIKYFVSRKNVFFKFLVKSCEELKEINELKIVYRIGRERIWLVPDAITMIEFNQIAPILLNACKDKGYCFSMRYPFINKSN